MKKLVTLLLAAGMVLGSFAGAQAIDWKVKGDWVFEFTLLDGMTFQKHEPGRTGHRRDQYGPGRGGNESNNRDSFQAGQRINFQIQAVASENLAGTLHLEIGGHRWGNQGTSGDRGWGGAMGQRGVSIGVRDAYLDWFIPNTELNIRMGIQPIAIPGFAYGPSVFAQDVAGITASYKFNENVSLTALWARPYNDNYNPSAGAAARFGAAGEMDNVDMFALLVPLTFDGFKVTPWGMIGAIGPNTFRDRDGNVRSAGAFEVTRPNAYDRLPRQNNVLYGLAPAYVETNNRRAVNGGGRQYATAWWTGLTGEITAADPFRFAWDAVYGSVTHPDTGYMNRQGWFVTALAEYKLDWGVPGLYFWWGSGDNGNPTDGSERLPVVDINNGGTSYSSMGLYGPNYTQRAVGGVAVLGQAFHAGSWGIGARIRDMSFIEDLKHTLRVNFFGGTNEPVMAKYMLGKKWSGRNFGTANRDFYLDDANNAGNVYLTKLDYGLELNLDNSYKIYENLELLVELGYIHLWLDQSRSMWGSGTNARTGDPIRGVSVTDALKAFMYVRYTF